MNERNALYFLSFLLLMLRKVHLRSGLFFDSKLKDELTGIMSSPMYQKERDREFIGSRIISSPWFILDACISMSLLMISAALFFRALNIDRPVALVRPVEQPRQNPVLPQQRPVVSIPQNPVQSQENRAAFFQPHPGSSDVPSVSSSENDSEQASSGNSKKNR